MYRTLRRCRSQSQVNRAVMWWGRGRRCRGQHIVVGETLVVVLHLVLLHHARGATAEDGATDVDVRATVAVVYLVTHVHLKRLERAFREDHVPVLLLSWSKVDRALPDPSLTRLIITIALVARKLQHLCQVLRCGDPEVYQRIVDEEQPLLSVAGRVRNRDGLELHVSTSVRAEGVGLEGPGDGFGGYKRFSWSSAVPGARECAVAEDVDGRRE